MKQLHPGALWQLRLRAYYLLIFLGIFLTVFSAARLSVNMDPSQFYLLIVAYVILVIILAEVYARMSYNRWFYEFTKTNLKLERGIIWKRYSNVPYERVQNVDIRRGILARIFGFSEVYIQTAGYGGGNQKGMSAEGYIPAVKPEEAEQIRDFLMKKISKNRQGL